MKQRSSKVCDFFFLDTNCQNNGCGLYTSVYSTKNKEKIVQIEIGQNLIICATYDTIVQAFS